MDNAKSSTSGPVPMDGAKRMIRLHFPARLDREADRGPHQESNGGEPQEVTEFQTNHSEVLL
jgi:hypothetical protein